MMMTLGRRGFLGGLAAASALARPAWGAIAPRLFDTHIHLISQDTTRYPRAHNEVPAGAAPDGAPPPGSRVQQGKPHPVPTRESVLAWWNAAGVTAGAVVQKKGTYGYDNSYILDSADASPTRMAPVVVLDASDPATHDRVEMLVRQHGLAGVRLTGPRDAYGWLSSPMALKTWEVANRHGLVIDLMAVAPGYFPAALDEIARLAVAHPQVRVVLDHLGWPRVEGAPGFGIDDEFLAHVTAPNIHFKLTTINLDILQEAGLPAAPFVAQALRKLGARRVMWGSDMGNTAGTYPEMVSRIMEASMGLSAPDRASLLHDTGARVFRRGGKA